MLFIYFLISILITTCMFKFLINSDSLNQYLDLYDYPNNRKIHDKKILKIGGIVILFCWLLVLLIYRLLNQEYILGINAAELDLIMSGSFIFLGAILDDIIGINAPKKLFFQLISIFILINSGYLFELFNNYLFNIIVTICLFILIINSMNLIDGIDGLSSSLFFLFSLFVILSNNYLDIFSSKYIIICVIFLGSLLSFIIFNFPPATVFLGDTGSQLLGWLAAVFVIQGSSNFILLSQKIYLLSVISLPFYDVFFVMIKRYLHFKGNLFDKFVNIVKPDQNHIHHMLLFVGYSPMKSMLIITLFYLFCLCLSIIPILFKSFYLTTFVIVLVLNISFRLFFERKLKLTNN